MVEIRTITVEHPQWGPLKFHVSVTTGDAKTHSVCSDHPALINTLVSLAMVEVKAECGRDRIGGA